MAIDETDGDFGRNILRRYTDRFGWDTTKRYAKERSLNLPGKFITEWQVAGYFALANDDNRLSNLEHQKQLPEPNIMSLVVPKTIDGKLLEWKTNQSDKHGFLNLSLGDTTENTIAYARCWLWSPDLRAIDFTIGSDDACRMWVGEELVFHDASWHGARKDNTFGSCTVQKGWNPVLFKVLNGLDGMGLYFRVLDSEITSTSSAPQNK